MEPGSSNKRIRSRLRANCPCSLGLTRPNTGRVGVEVLKQVNIPECELRVLRTLMGFNLCKNEIARLLIEVLMIRVGHRINKCFPEIVQQPVAVRILNKHLTA